MAHYFAYDPFGGFTEHETEDEARGFAQRCLDECTDNGDGVEEAEVTGICWGEIREIAVIGNKRELTAEEREKHPDWDYVYADVDLKPVNR